MHGYAVAVGAMPLDAEAALGITWRLLYPAVVDRFGGSPRADADAFRRVAAEMERVGSAMSQNVAKPLALVDAGYVVLDHTAGGRLVDQIGTTELRSDRVRGRRSGDPRAASGTWRRPTRGTPLERLLAEDHVSAAAGQRGLRRRSAGLHFIRPIHVGELVESRALVIHTGRTSLHVAIDIYARDPKDPELKRTGHCVIVFVALDDKGRPRPVPSWTPVTDTDRALQAYARRMIDLRKMMDAELETHLLQLEQSTAGAVAING